MPIDVFSRVKDGELQIVNENNNQCNVKFKIKKKGYLLTRVFTVHHHYQKNTII